MNNLLCLIRNNRYSLRDMAEITGTTRHRVAWFVAELERRGYISVQRGWVSNISRKTNNYKVKI